MSWSVYRLYHAVDQDCSIFNIKLIPREKGLVDFIKSLAQHLFQGKKCLEKGKKVCGLIFVLAFKDYVNLFLYKISFKVTEFFRVGMV